VSYRLITSSDALERIMPDLMREDVAGVDMEADSMYHFAEQVCLIQIATASECLIIDPLAIRNLSLLKPFFMTPAITKIFHGASYDVRCLDRNFNIKINSLFDSEIAARFLGFHETGLNSMVQHIFQKALDKKYQKKDWSCRPLPAEMLEYAARDVLYLIPLWTILKEHLEQKKRTAWVEEECRLISLARPAPENGHPLFLKFKGAGRLDRRGLAVLEGLLQERQDIARKKNLPPFKIFSNSALLRMAEEKPAGQTALRQSKILSEKQLSMYADPVCRAIQKALDMNDKKLPVYPREKQKPLSRKASLRVDALKKWREKIAGNLAMDPGLILPNALAMAIAREKPQTVRQLDGIADMKEWQKKEFGKDIIRAVNDVS